MFGIITIKFEGAVPGNMSKRDFNNNILKPAWQATGEFFHQTMMPIRFTHKGARLLKYTPRSGERVGVGYKKFARTYTGRKKRQKGHTLPLVWSGESRKLAMIRDIRATSKGVKIKNKARGLNRKSRHSDIRMNEEVRRVADSERAKLIRHQSKQVSDRLKQFRKTSVRKIGT